MPERFKTATFSKTSSRPDMFSTCTHTLTPPPCRSNTVSVRQNSFSCITVSLSFSRSSFTKRSARLSGANGCFAGVCVEMFSPAILISETGISQSASPNAPADKIPFFSLKCKPQNSKSIFILSFRRSCSAKFIAQTERYVDGALKIPETNIGHMRASLSLFRSCL